ncbi:hypothetical protein [Varunaivibrio sulfuroxidans]|uniref:Lipoprotein n=1 Tax=Varunaivibrio sulfuroxidans TaxID=1773489 RepID=A0A4R3JFR0_9PROT|nr:hypothetical protein [Varunaivibrio sulfuroxidans]TCS64968.1 hypothetical protein EDD55_101300 [Varunaivibrio sulfuroxidans]WES29740.1 hypothetical protein P3M64_08770 [Varunaivibrio sulfuroxidans]
MSLRSVFIRAVFVVATLAVAGCQTTPPTQVLPEISFVYKAPIALNVAKIVVRSTYQAPLAPPHIEYRLATTPEKALRRWAADRLRAVGDSGVATFVIENASVIAQPLKTPAGIETLFGAAQSERYRADVKAVLEISDGGGHGFARAQASHTRTIAEDASLNDRQRVWFDLVDKVTRAFDTTMEKNIRAHLASWIR